MRCWKSDARLRALGRRVERYQALELELCGVDELRVSLSHSGASAVAPPSDGPRARVERPLSSGLRVRERKVTRPENQTGGVEGGSREQPRQRGPGVQDPGPSGYLTHGGDAESHCG